jgi:hypothetical protein
MVSQMEQRVHEPSMECLACGYCLAGVPLGACPVCGEEMGAAQEVIGCNRRVFISQTSRFLRLLALLNGVIILLMAAALTVFSNELVGAAVRVLLMLGLVGITIFGSQPGQVLFPKSKRRLVFMIWLRWVWLLQLPWLIMGPGVLLTIFLAERNPEKFYETDVPPLPILLLFGVVMVWAVAGLAFAFQIRRTFSRLGLPIDGGIVALYTPAIVLMVLNGGVAIFGSLQVLGVLLSAPGQ